MLRTKRPDYFTKREVNGGSLDEKPTNHIHDCRHWQRQCSTNNSIRIPSLSSLTIQQKDNLNWTHYGESTTAQQWNSSTEKQTHLFIDILNECHAQTITTATFSHLYPRNASYVISHFQIYTHGQLQLLSRLFSEMMLCIPWKRCGCCLQCVGGVSCLPLLVELQQLGKRTRNEWVLRFYGGELC